MTLTNLKELNEENPAPFTNDKIVNLDDYMEQNRFITFSEGTEKGEVPLSKIVGHAQIYDTMIWGEALNGSNLKRVDRALIELSENPDYYKNEAEENKAGWSFIKIGDDYFIETGKHRTIISRFFSHFNPDIFGAEPVISGVEIHTKKIDYELMKMRDEIMILEKIYPRLTFVPHYTDDKEMPVLTIFPHNNGFSESFNRKEVMGALESLRNPSIIKKFGEEKVYRFIPLESCMRSIFRSMRS